MNSTTTDAAHTGHAPASDVAPGAVGPAGLALPLALAAEMAARTGTRAGRAPEITTASRRRRAARRRGTAVQG